MIDIAKFNDVLTASGYKKSHIANMLGITKQSLSNKIYNKTEFKSNEARKIKELLSLSDKDFVEIFFAPECDLQPHGPKKEAI